jgi:hypothetical protein
MRPVTPFMMMPIFRIPVLPLKIRSFDKKFDPAIFHEQGHNEE